MKLSVKQKICLPCGSSRFSLMGLAGTLASCVRSTSELSQAASTTFFARETRAFKNSSTFRGSGTTETAPTRC